MPRDAITACEPAEYVAVLDLYQRAHALRWRPFRATQRSLSTRWGIGNRRVWSLLESLRDLKLLSFERGGKRKPTVITVFCPTKKVHQSDHRPDHRPDHHNSSDSTDDMDEDAPQVAPQHAPQDAPLLDETQDVAGESESDHPPDPPSGGNEDLVEVLVRGLRKLGPDDLDLTLAAWGDPDEDAFAGAKAWCRGRGVRTTGLRKAMIEAVHRAGAEAK